MDVFQLSFGPITCHAFNKDKSQVAVCLNDHRVQIFQRDGQEWKLLHTLQNHDKLVTSIDWAPNTNRIVSCSQDRNAYVWNYNASTQQWQPTLVLLRINRAATFVRWSPLENKFAVCSGARCVSVCYFEEENDWWVSKHLKKPIRSTVLSLDWHPNNILLAIGGSDMKVRVFSAYVKGLDEKPPASGWGERLPFHTFCAEYTTQNGGWVHSVAFSPDGNQLGWVAHDAALYIADPVKQSVEVVKTNGMPFLSMIWLSPTSVMAVGHDCCPVMFGKKGDQWKMIEKIDRAEKKEANVSSISSARDKFRQLDSKAQEQPTSTDLPSVHQNSISSIRVFEGSRDNVAKFSTSGVDGRLVIWHLKTLASQFANLKI